MELFPKIINSYLLSATHHTRPLHSPMQRKIMIDVWQGLQFFSKNTFIYVNKLSQTIYFVKDMVYSCKLSKSQHVIVVRTVVSLISLLVVDAKEVVRR